MKQMESKQGGKGEGGGNLVENLTMIRRPSCECHGLLPAGVGQRLDLLDAASVQRHVSVQNVLDHALAHGGFVGFG